ncbi:hypothetical protein [Corynebacterium phoceense]|nr:hypothetical protein [Corynebacterium phoceense]
MRTRRARRPTTTSFNNENIAGCLITAPHRVGSIPVNFADVSPE